MNRKWSLVMVALATALAMSLSAWGQSAGQERGPRGRGFGPGGHGGPGLLRGLTLTDTQRTQVREIMEAQREATPMQKLGDLHRQLHEAIFVDNPDRAKVQELKDAIAAAEVVALESRIETQLKIAQILTPEQRQQAREHTRSARRR